MKQVLMLTAMALAMVVPAAPAGAGHGGSGDGVSKATAGLDKLKSLAGVWESKGNDSERVTVAYEVVSNGSAVMESIRHADAPDMITVYYINGDRLMMTHFCALGNQPRMKASVPAGDIKELRFSYVDGTNMRKSDTHMHGLVMQFLSNTHVHAAWTVYEKGRPTHEVVFELARRS